MFKQILMLKTVLSLIVLTEGGSILAESSPCNLQDLTTSDDIKGFRECLKATKDLSESNISSEDDSINILMFVINSHSDHKRALTDSILKSKVDPNIRSKKGRTALHFASEHADVEIVKLLLKAKADTRKFTL
jgi:hypothetical protein